MKKKIFVFGKHTEILQTVLRLLNKRPDWEAEGTTEADQIIPLFSRKPYSLVLLGGGVSGEEERFIRNRVQELAPGLPVIQHFGGGSGLLFNEIEAGLEKNPSGNFRVS